MFSRKSIPVIALALLVAGLNCVDPAPIPQSSTMVYTESASQSPTPTAQNAPTASTEAQSGNPVTVIPSPTHEVDTPTPVQPVGTPVIIEVTPLPEPPSTSGEKRTSLLPGSTYKPDCTTSQNVRNEANLDSDVVRRIPCGQAVPVYVMIEVLGTGGDTWLCLDPANNQSAVIEGSDCHEVVALFVGGHQFGELVSPNLLIFKKADYHDLQLGAGHREMLAWLVWVEARGMNEAYWSSALSVISTVMERTDKKVLSNGTIDGTIGWCNEDGSLCQFPAWVADLGCEGVTLCPLNDTAGLIVAREAVNLYEFGYRGSCDGYLYYDSLDNGGGDCLIVSGDKFIEFHN